MIPKSVHATIKAHRGQINTLCYNPAGAYVLSGGQDRTICLWNTSSHELIQTYRMHAYEVIDIAITADSSKFASCGGDRTVFLWDVRTSKAITRFSGHLARVNTVTFAGSVLASGSFDGSVKLWDLKSNSAKPIQTLNDAKDSVSCVDIYNHLILTASVDGKLRTYDLRMGTLTTDPISDSPLTSVQVLQDGEAALVSSLDSKIQLLDLQNQCAPLQVLHGHRNEEYKLKPALASNDTMVLAPSESDGCIYAWDLLDEKPVAKLNGNGGPKGFALAVSPSESENMHFVSSSFQGDINFW